MMDGWCDRLKEIPKLRNILRPITSDPSKINIVYREEFLKVRTHDIPKYVDDSFYQKCVNFYYKIKAHGSNIWHNRGWYEWPCWAHDIYDVLSVEEAKYKVYSK